MKYALLPAVLVLAAVAASSPTPTVAIGPGAGGEPVLVKDLANVVSVAAGRDHALALRADRTLWAWGSNAQGQLGRSDIAESARPALVAGVSDVVMIAAGAGYSLAVTADGRAWSWGANERGQLGSGSMQPNPPPVQVPDLTDIVAVSAGTAHALALHRERPQQHVRAYPERVEQELRIRRQRKHDLGWHQDLRVGCRRSHFGDYSGIPPHRVLVGADH
jgi:hypothetical protein